MKWDKNLKKLIPSDWHTSRLADVCNLYLGGTPNTSNEKYWNGNINWLNSGELSKFPIASSELKITEEGLLNSSTKLMKKGSIVVSITGNLRASILAIDTCANQSVVVIEENKLLKRSYLYPLICNKINYYTNISTGNCQKHINKGILADSYILIPPNNILKKFYSITSSIYEELDKTSIQNEQLKNIQNWLLPMLMNGQSVISN